MKLRSGRLTRARVDQIARWVERLPNDLKKVAKACNIYPADLMAWYLFGQGPECTDPICVELAWRVNEIRANKAAENYARLQKLAEEGDFRAIEKIDAKSDESPWEIAPDAEQAEEINRVFRTSSPTPLLTAGESDEQPGAPAEGEPDPAAVHQGPPGADHLPGGAPARED